jgi:hypothetical protein
MINNMVHLAAILAFNYKPKRDTRQYDSLGQRQDIVNPLKKVSKLSA